MRCLESAIPLLQTAVEPLIAKSRSLPRIRLAGRTAAFMSPGPAFGRTSAFTSLRSTPRQPDPALCCPSTRQSVHALVESRGCLTSRGRRVAPASSARTARRSNAGSRPDSARESLSERRAPAPPDARR